MPACSPRAHLFAAEARGLPPFLRGDEADFVMHAGDGIIGKAMRLDFRRGGSRSLLIARKRCLDFAIVAEMFVAAAVAAVGYIWFDGLVASIWTILFQTSRPSPRISMDAFVTASQ